MHIYRCAMQDYLGHVALECRERAMMLSLLWDHFASLVVVYTRLGLQEREVKAEIDIGAMEEEMRRLKQDLKAKDSECKVEETPPCNIKGSMRLLLRVWDKTAWGFAF